jgi:cobalt-precorrin 5A hydrolase
MIAVIAISKEGKKIAKTLSSGFSGKTRLYFPSAGHLKGLVAEIFDKDKFEGFVFIMACGIVVRIIAARLKDKHNDPAVVVVDEGKHFSISLVSGHEGGANKLAIEVANILCCEPVITTGSEARKKLVVGVGCRRGIEKEEVIKAIEYAVKEAQSSIDNLRYVATIDLKQNEKGLRNACLKLGVPLRIISTGLIKNFDGKYQRSSFVKDKIGVEGVSEPCALIAAKNPKLILPKRKVGRVTVAVAGEN